MNKELDEVYKRYSCRITEIDDTPLVKVMDGGKFKLLSIEEYEEMTNKLADLEAKLAEMKESCVLLEGLRKSEEEKKDITMKRVSQLKQQLADTEAQNKRVLEKLDLITRSNQELEKQLAEKTLTIEQINKAFIENRNLWKGKYERVNQDKISFCIEKLEKVKELFEERYRYDVEESEYAVVYEDDVDEIIDNQIKELKKEIE